MADSIIERLLEAGDWDGLSVEVRRRWGVSFAAEDLERVLLPEYGKLLAGRKLFRQAGVLPWNSDSSWASWLKMQITKAGGFALTGEPVPVGRLTVDLHFGNWRHTATPEEMERLMFGMTIDDSDRGGYSTPGIERVTTMPTPIDGTAARVTDFRGAQ